MITVVVPVYNVEDYIAECIHSILNQTFTQFEAIIVNDGTQDNSIEVALACIDGDSRFHVIHQQHQGLGPARNTGIDHARGQYICFIDSDDFIDPDFLKLMYQKLQQTQSHICSCNLALYSDKGTQHLNIDLASNNAIEAITKICLGFDGGSAANRLYRRTHSVQFPQAISYEDKIFNIRLFLENAHKPIVSVNKPLYFYRQRAGSITHSCTKQIIETFAWQLAKIKQLLLEHGVYQELQHECYFFIINENANILIKIAKLSRNLQQDYNYLKQQYLKHALTNELKLLKFFNALRYIQYYNNCYKMKIFLKILTICTLAKLHSVGFYTLKLMLRLKPLTKIFMNKAP